MNQRLSYWILGSILLMFNSYYGIGQVDNEICGVIPSFHPTSGSARLNFYYNPWETANATSFHLRKLSAQIISAEFIQFDSTNPYGAVITANLVSPEYEDTGWLLEIFLQHPLDWEEWSTINPSNTYHGSPDSDEHLNSTYYPLVSGSLTGYGTFEGSSLNLADNNNNTAHRTLQIGHGVFLGFSDGFGAYHHYYASGTRYDPLSNSIVDVEEEIYVLRFDLLECANVETQSCEILPTIENEVGTGEAYNLKTPLCDLEGNPSQEDLSAMISSGAEFVIQDSSSNGNIATLNARLTSINDPNAGWDMELCLTDGMNWEEWSNQDFPTSYRDDAELAGDNYLNWKYYLLDKGSLKGWGNWEGSEVNLAHSPVNNFYRFQVGIGANGWNSQYGASGWTIANGTIFNQVTETLELIEEGCSQILVFDFGDCFEGESECQVSSAGEDQTVALCIGPTQLEASLACNQLGQWSIISGAGSFSDAQDPNSTFTGEVGNNELEWRTICNNQISMDTVIISVFDTFPVPIAGADQELLLCDELMVQLEGEIIEGQALYWTQQAGPSLSISDPTDLSPIIPITVPGNYVFRWQYQDQCGETHFSEQTIVILDDLLEDYQDCNSYIELTEIPLTFELTGTELGSVYTGSWLIESSLSGDIDDVDASQTFASNLTYGQYIFNWTLVNTTCGTSHTCSDTLFIVTPSGCTLDFATNYDPEAINEDGSCEFDFTICDCNENSHSPNTILQLGDENPNDTDELNFNCETWGYDCGDILGAPNEDPFDVCNRNIPPSSGCRCFPQGLELSIGANQLNPDTTIVDGELFIDHICINVVNVVPTISGDCSILELCFAFGEEVFSCIDLSTIDPLYYSGDLIEFQTTVETQTAKFYYVTEDDTSDIYTIFVPLCTTSIQEELSPPVSVFPNPADELIYVQSQAKFYTEIILLNGLGQEVKSMQIQHSETNQIDVSNLNNGVYILQLIDDGKPLQQHRIVIQKNH